MDSATAKAKFRQAKALFAAGDHYGAIALLDELINAFPDHDELARGRTRVLSAISASDAPPPLPPAPPPAPAPEPHATRRSHPFRWVAAPLIILLIAAGAWYLTTTQKGALSPSDPVPPISTALSSEPVTPDSTALSSEPVTPDSTALSSEPVTPDGAATPPDASTSEPAHPHNDPKIETITGRWAWFNGPIVLIEPNATFCVVEDGHVEPADPADPAQRRFRFTWEKGRETTEWLLSSDGNTLTPPPPETRPRVARRVTDPKPDSGDTTSPALLEGTWHWFDNNALLAITDIGPHGECTLKHTQYGAIQARDDGTFILKWPGSDYIDTLRLDPSRQRLEGQNQQGVQVSGTRLPDKPAQQPPQAKSEAPLPADASSRNTFSDNGRRLPLKVLYAGIPGIRRETQFREFLSDHFLAVKTIDYAIFSRTAARPYDVVILDYVPEGQWEWPPKLKLPADYDRPTIAIRGAGVPDNLCFRPG